MSFESDMSSYYADVKMDIDRERKLTIKRLETENDQLKEHMKKIIKSCDDVDEILYKEIKILKQENTQLEHDIAQREMEIARLQQENDILQLENIKGGSVLDDYKEEVDRLRQALKNQQYINDRDTEWIINAGKELAEISRLSQENDRLKEYEFMYKELSK